MRNVYTVDNLETMIAVSSRTFIGLKFYQARELENKVNVVA